MRRFLLAASVLSVIVGLSFLYFYLEERRLDRWYRIDPAYRPRPPRPIGLR